MILINFAIKYRDNMRQFILLISLLSMFPLGAWCEDGDTFVAQTPEGCSMTFTVISEAEKTACVGNEVDPAIDVETKGKITIPVIVNGYQVKRIGVRAFVQCNQIEEIVMPKGIISIGDIAFHSCEKLQSMNIPEGVKNIGEGAFAWCKELKSVTIPSSVTETEPWIFLECRNLQSVYSDIPSPSPVWIATFSVNYPPQPDNGTNNFDPDELYNQATLYVPKGCTEKYQNTEGWNLFTNIVEEDKAERIPFVQDGKEWKYIGYSTSGVVPKIEEMWEYCYYLQGDTVIGGIPCLKLYYEGGKNNVSKDYWGAMYEEEGKVYFIPRGKDVPILLYDFSCQKDDTIEFHTMYGDMKAVVGDIQTIKYMGDDYRVLSLQNITMRDEWVADMSEGCWIEGVGSIYDLFTPLRAPGDGRELISCELDGVVIFDYYTFTHRQDMGVYAKVKINGLKYELRWNHTAIVVNENQWNGELDIPEQVTYEGEEYTVNSIEWVAFMSCKTLTRVRLPKTIASIEHYAGYEDCKNPFSGCTSLEAIEVDEENPWMCSVDGVLFNKDKTWLYCYPAGAKRNAYNIPESVERIGGAAFAYNSYLTSVYMPNSVTKTAFSTFAGCKSLNSIRLPENLKYISARAFANCESLHLLDIPASVSEFEESVFSGSPIKTIVIRGSFSKELRKDTFYSMDDEVVIYVQKSEIEKFKKVFSGTIRPLEEYQEIQEPEYRPFIEDGKVWKVGHFNEETDICNAFYYYYFDGDTIVGGKPCKRMMCRKVIIENLIDDYPFTSESTNYAGAFYEENRQVYIALPNDEEFLLLYDFKSEVGDTIDVHSAHLFNGKKTISGVIVDKGELVIPVYKGNYVKVKVKNPYGDPTEDIENRWLEGVGTDEEPTLGLFLPIEGYSADLFSCTVGDEVLYKNPYFEDLYPDIESGETTPTPTAKRRVDFTHVVKKKPKAPQRRVQESEDVAVSGEYTQTALTIDLGTLQDTYVVTITDPSGQSVYAKDVKTNRVLALDIDISAYTEDAYTITLENEDEIFEGNFRLSDLTSIHEVTTPRTPSDVYHDLTGRRVTTPTKGIYIHNGKKVLVK